MAHSGNEYNTAWAQRRRDWIAANPEYRSWVNMKTRCLNPNSGKWNRYGGRGITVCERWSASFADFLADVGRRPFASATLERKNNDGNYEPGNVHWVGRREQARNRSSNRMVVVGGVKMSLAEAGEHCAEGISTATLQCRLDRGWPVETAMSLPVSHTPLARRA